MSILDMVNKANVTALGKMYIGNRISNLPSVKTLPGLNDFKIGGKSLSDALGIEIPCTPPDVGGQWNLISYRTGRPILTFQSFLKASLQADASVVSDSIEQTSFASYNKVTSPKKYHFDLAIKNKQFGTTSFGVNPIAARTVPDTFQQAYYALEDLKDSTEMFSFVSPSMEYRNLTLSNYTINWENTTDLIIVGLDCVEIREVQAAYTKVDTSDLTAAQESARQQAEAEKQKTEVKASADSGSIGEPDATDDSNTDTVSTGDVQPEAPSENTNESTLHKYGGTIWG